MSERRAYRISGRVQGVGFRWWTRRQADHLGVRGVVRNDSDGTVHVEAEGDIASLERLEQLLRDGPPGAQVQEVRPEPPGEGALPAGFEIRS